MTRHARVNGMLTASDVARLLNVHMNTVRRWTNKGILKTYRVGPRGDRRFRQEDIGSFLIEQLEKAEGARYSESAVLGQGKWPKKSGQIE